MGEFVSACTIPDYWKYYLANQKRRRRRRRTWQFATAYPTEAEPSIIAFI
jgi:hypothetical protein